MSNIEFKSHLVQANGCHKWQNPLTGIKFEPPKKIIEIFIRNLPKDMSEHEIFVHFQRFGEIYQFRILVDYDDKNRGFAYLIYFNEKSALECLDCMGYFLIKPGVMLDVERSGDRSYLLALGIPCQLSHDAIVSGLKNLFIHITNVYVQRRGNTECIAILEFPNHGTALNAKRWSGIGSINLWNRQIKILWAKEEEVERIKNPTGEAKWLLFHFVPKDLEVEEFGKIISNFVPEESIVSIRPMNSDWLVEFLDDSYASQGFSGLDRYRIGNSIILAEWIDSYRLKQIKSVADFDFELRCFCYANYWSPPIFIYGRVIAMQKTQFVAVIIKNNRKNLFVTIVLEISYEDLIEIHSRVCETILLTLMELKDFPKFHLVIKVLKFSAYIVGHIPQLQEPKFYTSTVAKTEAMSIFITEIFDLAGMCAQLILKKLSDDKNQELFFNEYKEIIGKKNINHQFISNLKYKHFVLGCIDPRYRLGKPLKYQMNTRETILVMCDEVTRSNVNAVGTGLVESKSFPLSTSCRMRIEKFELLPFDAVQRKDVHFCIRPCIEFTQTDTFSILYRAIFPTTYSENFIQIPPTN